MAKKKISTKRQKKKRKGTRARTRPIEAATRSKPPEDISKLPDEELMRRCQMGEESTFDELFTRYEGPTLALLSRLIGDRAAAEACLERLRRQFEGKGIPGDGRRQLHGDTRCS